jgi:DNA-binding transcriptional LysR family regulator
MIEEASLMGAADVLCVSKAVISKRIQRFERLLGTELFDHISKPRRRLRL